MQVHCDEGRATRIGPESFAGVRGREAKRWQGSVQASHIAAKR
jgi:hypothetical protein